MEASLQQDEQFPANKNTKCILPWIHQYGDLSGQYGLCCFSIYQNEKNSFGKGTRPSEAFNHPFMKSTRLAMLNNEEVSACKICYDWEKNGIESHRQRMNIRFSQYSFLYGNTSSDGHINSPPIYIDFRFGNICNFKCRMCGSFASSAWSKEAKFHGMMHETEPNHFDYWTNNDSFWKDIDQIKKYIRVIYFAGGEPFVQEGHYKLLEFLANNDCTNIEISYNTNLSYDGKFKKYKIEDLWDKFTKVELWPSVDGFKLKAEYGRKGLEWSLFEANVLRFLPYISTFSIVGNIYSISSNCELVKWIKSLNKTFNITNLVHPEFLSTSILDKQTKKLIIASYNEFLKSNYKLFNENEINSILDSLKHMRYNDDSHLSQKFKQYNVKLDLYRNESFENTYPELAEWYKNI